MAVRTLNECSQFNLQTSHRYRDWFCIRYLNKMAYKSLCCQFASSYSEINRITNHETGSFRSYVNFLKFPDPNVRVHAQLRCRTHTDTRTCAFDNWAATLACVAWQMMHRPVDSFPPHSRSIRYTTSQFTLHRTRLRTAFSRCTPLHFHADARANGHY
jgi:hypothetical protein